MSGDHSFGNDSQDKFGVQTLERMETSDSYVSPVTHEKVYLSPENAVKGDLRKTFGNPTPVALGGFLLANTPATIDLMGWRGAGAGIGNAAAGTASYIYFGGLLLLAGGVGEWVLGNTFPSVVFFTFSGFWLTFGETLTPFYATVTSYTYSNGTADPDGFYDSFAFFLVFMAVLCFVYMICALRTNIILVLVLFLFCITFPCLSASYFYGAAGHAAISANTRIAGAACAFVASMLAWYLFTSLLFESVDFPISLPVGDLSTHFKGKMDRKKARRASQGEAGHV